jgi:hypothetical protein
VNNGADQPRLRRALRRGRRLLGHTPQRQDFLRRLPRHAVAAEIGVFRGEFTETILKANRPRELHLIDVWWELHGEHFPDWGKYTDFGRLTTRQAYDETLAVLERLGGRTRTTVHVGDDLSIVPNFPDAYFDWVYLDTSHQYAHTLDELRTLADKIKPQGFIAGDDWRDDPGHVHHGASVAIKEFCEENGWRVDHRDSFHQWRISRLP